MALDMPISKDKKKPREPAILSNLALVYVNQVAVASLIPMKFGDVF